MQLIEAPPRACLDTLDIRTFDAQQSVDLTDRVAGVVGGSRIRSGMVCTFSQHTTMATVIQEPEPLLMTDLAYFVERLAPRGARYRHNDFSVRTVNIREDECPNGHSHCRHLVLGASETVPVVDGRMAQGQWQRLFAVELDADKVRHSDCRKVAVQVLGV